ncbi:MAG TPA: arginase family protein, partial [Candidatus Acidoferrales bacterium]|nr:arginase family protein [Candidatus Acidoferrales bacterium]
KKIAIIGIPSSAGSHGPGAEQAPAALRAAGLQARLEAAGFEVSDHGDTPVFPYKPDEEHPRARNTTAVVEALNALRTKVELAAKSGALLLILGGDCAITPGTIAGLRRYYREVGVFWMDRDADLNTPATSPSGCVHGMTVAHLTGRGAPEIVRFSADMPMVREPNLALYGIERLDPPEEQLLASAPLRAYHAADILRRGAAATAREAMDRIHGHRIPFMLHYDVDVISSPDFTACGFPAEGSLHTPHVREALAEVLASPQLLAVELCEYFPSLDADGSAARFLVELFAENLAERLRPPAQPPAAAETQDQAAPVNEQAAPAHEQAPATDEPEPSPAAAPQESSPAAAEADAAAQRVHAEADSNPAIDASATSAGS